jgi:polyisoprenoid-binding protein YceI
MRRRRRDGSGVTALDDLTIRDVTRPIELDVSLDGITHDPWGGERLAITATGEIDREEYGMLWNVALEAGGWLVSQKVQIEIRAQAIRQS